MGYDLDTYFIEKPHHISPRRLYSQTGADWQVAWVNRYGRDFTGLVDAYAERGASDRPVYEWSL